VFCHQDGKIMRPSNINKKFNEFIALAGVPKIRFHDMRHYGE
jgi:integrase